MKSGLRLWDRAKKCIPGGNGLLSKRPERYVPDLWPTYFSKAKGVNIWDLEDNHYVDMAQMGIGTAILGYANDHVDEKVREAISNGVNTTLNPPEEVYLAEKLLQLNSFAGGVKFARTGAEAMSIAIRIARAYTGKEKIAFSGYHGWSDWYLATNLENENNLNEHLLEGLSPKGIPVGLSGTAIPFKYNDSFDLEKQVKDKDIGAIVIEGARYDFASEDFLQSIKKIADEKNAVIIFDEITSGWRMNCGGVFKSYNNFEPDIAVFGKAMGNGYAISAVVGKGDIMDSAQDTFISSTFWTERVGFVAALETINQLEKLQVHKNLIKTGEFISKGWNNLFNKYDLDIKTTDFLPLITFKPNYGKLNNKILTYISQEMLKMGYLAANSVYVSNSHSEKIVQDYLDCLDKVLKNLSLCIKSKALDASLETRVREFGFERLN